MFKGVGNFVVKYRIWIIAVWVILAAVMLIFAPSLKEVGKLDNSAFLPEDTESGQGRELIRQYFPDSAVSSISLVFYDAEGLSEGDLTAARDIWAWLNSSEGSALSVNKTNSIFDNPQLEATLISPDNTTMILSVGTSGAIDNNEVVEALRDHLKSVPTDMQVYVSGEGGIIADLQDAILQSLDRTTLITILLVIVLLLIIYRSPVASLVPLITIGAAYLVSRGALGFIAQAGVSVWSQLDALVIVLVFGVGTEYCLFMVSRFREELKVQDSRVAAMRHTISKIGIVITASAFTVIIGLCGMAIARFEMLKTMGPLMGLTVFITLLAALTLAPAMASIMGKYLYWPTHEQVVQPGRGKAGKTRVPFFQRISHLATGKPVRVIIVVLVILAIPCVFYPQFNRSFDQTEEVPTKYESIKGYNVLEDHYDIGEMEPVDTVLAAPAGIDLTSPQYLTALKDTVNDLSRVDGVLNIKSIINPQGGSEPLPALTVSGQLATLAESLNSSGQDIGSLFSPSTTQGFQLLNAYMLELGDNFSWVQDDTSYQRVLADLDNLQVELEQIKTQAGVGNQLQTLVTRLSQTGSSEFVPEAAGQYLQIIKGYLTELGQQYPDLQSSVDYQSALKICTDGLTMLSQMSTLPAAQQAVLAAQLQTGWQQLIGSLTALQQAFQGQETYCCLKRWLPLPELITRLLLRPFRLSWKI
jgi:RND superfamily putative drug exporter